MVEFGVEVQNLPNFHVEPMTLPLRFFVHVLLRMFVL